jgi:hypothetical protein
MRLGARAVVVPVLLLVATLGGCGHMPVTSMLKLARIDFTNTDPAQLRAAVKLPRVVQPRPQGMALRIGVKLSGGQEEFEDFVLREVSEPKDVLALHRELDADTHVFAYRLDPTEVARLVAFRDALKKKQAASGGSGGSLSIAIRPQACRSGELPSRPIMVTTYLRTAETGDYVPLTRDIDLRTIDPKQDLAATIPPCMVGRVSGPPVVP